MLGLSSESARIRFGSRSLVWLEAITSPQQESLHFLHPSTVITLPLPGDPQPRAAVVCFYLSHPSGRKNLASLMYLLCVSGAIAILVLLFLMVGERPPRVTTDCGSVEGVFDSPLQSFYFLVSD